VSERFDVVVIGTGTAATTVATRCRAADRQVAIVDSRPFGGTCALRGCDPKKVMVGVAEIVDSGRRMAGKGVRAEGLRVEWAELMRFKRTFTDPVPASREKSYEEAGIAAFRGRARFEGRDIVLAGETVLTAPCIVIATGAKPGRTGITGEELLTSSEEFMELGRLPEDIVFLGGGYIAFEFAHIARRAGARVTIVQRGNRVLKRFDAGLVGMLVGHSKRLGIDVRMAMNPERLEGRHGALRLSGTQAGEKSALQTAMVVHSAGRVPDLEDLMLETAGVDYGAKGVVVNEYLQSPSNPAVYAAGDASASAGAALTPVAEYEGRVVADNCLNGNHRRADHRAVPSVVFSIPPLAAVGLTEEAARAQDLKFTVKHEDTTGWYSSRRIAEECSGYKILVEEGSGRILGAHLLGDRSEEVINLFALAMRTGMKAGELREMLCAYPTRGSDIEYML